jgi:phosphoglycolate phosphatase
MNRLALFDCDGTLVDSQHVICEAMDIAFIQHDLPPPPAAQTRRVVGLSLFEAMQTILPDADHALHASLADAYKNAFHTLRKRGQVDEPLFDGILPLIDRLATAGWMLGVATGKSDRGLALCLAHHGIADRFVTLQTADRHPSKPHPAMAKQAIAEAGASPATTITIGDTSFDMLMGKAAGTHCIGVDWGYHHAHELVDAGADHVAEHPDDISRLLENWP